MIANLGPADWNYDETMSTLRYANRAKNIKNTPRINEDPKDAMLRGMEEEKAQLLAKLRGDGAMGPGSPGQRRRETQQLSDEEVARIRAEIEENMKFNLMSTGLQLSDAQLAQVCLAGRLVLLVPISLSLSRR